MKRPPNSFFAIIFMFAFSAAAMASTVYVSQSGGSVSCPPNGTQSTTAIGSVSWTSGNTYQLCGTITSHFTINANNVTVTFSTGAAVSASCTAGAGSACISATGISGLLMDGNPTTSGSPCGWVNQAEVACNGTVESSVAQPANSNFGIDATNCTNCEFRNMNIGPIYTVTSGGTQPSGDIRGIQALPSAGTGTWLVHNNILHDTSSAIVYVPNGSNDSGLQDYNNVTYNINSSQDISNNDNGTITGALVHDNNFGSTANWDTSGCDNHHNSMHVFSYTQTATGIYYYNNLVNGNWGNCSTGQLFIEGSSSLVNLVYVFNNVFIGTYTQENNGIVNITANNLNYFNNTIVGSRISGDNCIFLSTIGGNGKIYAENNIMTGCVGQLLASNTVANQFTPSNYNLFGGTSGSTPWAMSCGGSGCTYYNFSSWQGTGNDGKSTFNASTSFWGGNSSTGQLNSGSPAINAGTNLTSLGITALNSDATGAPRPATGSWTAGAYQFGTVPAPPAPTALTAVVH